LLEFEKAKSEISACVVQGEHTRKVKLVTPKKGGIMGFAQVTTMCPGCRAPIRPGGTGFWVNFNALGWRLIGVKQNHFHVPIVKRMERRQRCICNNWTLSNKRKENLEDCGLSARLAKDLSIKKYCAQRTCESCTYDRCII